MYLVNVLDTACKTAVGVDIPTALLNIVHYLYLGILIVVPILLILFGMIDLAKALTAQKEDEIKKATSGLLRKAVTAVVVFLVAGLVKFVFDFASQDLNDDNKGNLWNCVTCFIDGPDATSCKK